MIRFETNEPVNIPNCIVKEGGDFKELDLVSITKWGSNQLYTKVQAYWLKNGQWAEQDVGNYINNSFDADKAIAREAQVFTIDRIIALAPFTYTINEMIRYENWTQLKQMIGGLIQSGYATNEDYDNFNNILKEQDIDLDRF